MSQAPSRTSREESTSTPVLRHFTPAEFECVQRLVDLILPQTDTPGALQVGVAELVDQELSLAPPEIQEVWRAGIAWLNERALAEGGEPFARSPPASQHRWMDEISDERERRTEVGAALFAEAKKRTCRLYYGTDVGLLQELRYQGGKRVESFAGCRHPQHHSEG